MATPMLNELFVQLHTAHAPEEIDHLQDKIWQQWLDTGDIHLNNCMQEGMEAMQEDHYPSAIAQFTTIIEERPEFAEAWNKRATAYFLRGSYKQAIADIEVTLELEPRHFGALSGLVAIYLTISAWTHALHAAERLLAIIPNEDSARDQVLALRRKLGLNRAQ